MSRPRLLDLFSGAGGAAVGYHRAGFDVVGVDKESMKRYPFEFHQSDAIEYLAAHADEFDAIHASPPCQTYSTASNCRTGGRRKHHPDLVPPTRLALKASFRPWIMENVVGSPLINPIMLCGTMFGLRVFRHRLFESSFFMLAPSHDIHGSRKVGVGGFSMVCGHGGGSTVLMRDRMKANGHQESKRTWSNAMGIDWMTRDELAQAIPPAYTFFIGTQLLAYINSRAQ